MDFTPDLWSDGRCVGHIGDVKEEWGCFYEGEEGGSEEEVTCVVWRRVRRGAGRSKASSGVFREVCGTIGGVWRRSEG